MVFALNKSNPTRIGLKDDANLWAFVFYGLSPLQHIIEISKEEHNQSMQQKRLFWLVGGLVTRMKNSTYLDLENPEFDDHQD